MKNLDLVSLHTKLPSIDDQGIEIKAKVIVKKRLSTTKRVSTQPT